MQRFLRIHGEQLAGATCHRREGEVLPGVREVLEDLDGRADVVNLLLTGNTEAGAAAKLAHYGLGRLLPSRRRLLRRPGRAGRDRTSRAPARERRGGVYVIGDTPADIECGQAIEARTIAVATGSYSLAELAETSRGSARALPEPAAFGELVGLS